MPDNHNWESVDIIDEGSKVLPTIVESEHIPTLGHDYSYILSINKGATCVEEGEQTFCCRRCKQTLTESIPKLPHTLNHFERQEGTSVSEGFKEYWHCDACDKYFVDNGLVEVEWKDIVRDNATAHKWNKEQLFRGEDNNCKWCIKC